MFFQLMKAEREDQEMSSILLMTNSALVYEPKCRGMGGTVAGSKPMSTAVHMEPK
jgi:hypothetical protein